MRFLLTALNAKYIHSNPAIYSLRSYAGEKLQEHVEIAQYTINQATDQILADIYRRKPDVVGFSCYIWNITMVLEIVVELHKLLPQVPIWLGGPEASYDAPGILEKYPMITGVMIGEGEATFQELLEYYVSEVQGDLESEAEFTEQNSCREADYTEENQVKTLDKIPGLCLPGGYTAMRPLTDMDKIPFLYENLAEFENKIIYYESSRGCPFRCSYCLSSIDKKVRLRNLDIVRRELQFFLDNQVKQVKFVDRTFNCNHHHAMEIWKYILENDNDVTNFHFEVSADILNEEEIALLHQMRQGLVQLEIGVQSTNPDTIRAINRTMNVEKLENIVASIHKGKNVHQHLDLIAGLPYEDYVSFGKSFDRVYAMEPEQLQLGFLKVLKGSQMHEKAKKYGICYQDKPPYEVLYTRWLSYENVLQLKGIEEMVELYYNSNQFRHTLRFLEKCFESPFAMFEKMAKFYEREGYSSNSPARIYRYHVLLKFAVECDGEHEDIYKELLTYDMYLRENLKSRPDFAGDMTVYKDILREFYRQEEQERTYLPDYKAYDYKQLGKMTHVEAFFYPVWDVASCMEEGADDRGQNTALGKSRIPVFVLFDYQNRDPLTGDARNICLPALSAE